MENREKLINAIQAAEMVNLKPQTIRRHAWQRKIRSYLVAGTLRFKPSELEADLVKPRGKATQ